MTVMAAAMRVTVLAIVVWASLAGSAVVAPRPQARPDPVHDAIDEAMAALYNQDFAGAHRLLDAHLRANPNDALGHSARAATHLFAEFDRLQILDLDFFADDNKVTDQKRLAPDAAARGRIFASTAEGYRLAKEKLAAAPDDPRALFAMGMSLGVEAQYATVVEHRYVRGGSLSRELQGLPDRMLALKPPVYDAYLTLGSIEYVVGSLNFVYRMLARLAGLQGDKALAVEHLKIVAAQGRYYKPYAKLLLAVFYCRDGRLKEARALLDELRQSFPKNTFFPREVARLDAKIARVR